MEGSMLLDTVDVQSQTGCTLQKSTLLCVLMRILVAEDDAPLAEFLHQRLQQEHFAVQVVFDEEKHNVSLLSSPMISCFWIWRFRERLDWTFSAVFVPRSRTCPS